jgi:hypothetical protein
MKKVSTKTGSVARPKSLRKKSVSAAIPTKGSATGKVKSAAIAEVSSASVKLSEAELIALAKTVVPQRLHGTARVVRPTARKTAAGIGAGGPAIDEQVAKLVGAKLPAAEAPDAMVQFETQTSLGRRDTVVHVKGNKVTRVVTRA